MPDRWSGADAYEMYVGRWSRETARAFLRWLEVPPGLRWLDLGCGTGALSTQILNVCDPASVTGVDPSDSFLEKARLTTGDPRVQFLRGDGEAVPVGAAEVDVAVSGLVLNFIPDPRRAMAELVRSVGTGGTVAAYVWDYAGHVQFIRRFWDAAVALDPGARAHDEGARFPLCRPAALAALFSEAGLRDVTTTPIDIVTPFANFDDYWAPFLSGTGPAPAYCAALEDDARDSLRRRLSESLPADADGMILLAARAWAVRGTR